MAAVSAALASRGFFFFLSVLAYTQHLRASDSLAALLFFSLYVSVVCFGNVAVADLDEDRMWAGIFSSSYKVCTSSSGEFRFHCSKRLDALATPHPFTFKCVCQLSPPLHFVILNSRLGGEKLIAPGRDNGAD